jgi:DNA-binding Lrp family transcriptional regulator
VHDVSAGRILREDKGESTSPCKRTNIEVVIGPFVQSKGGKWTLGGIVLDDLDKRIVEELCISSQGSYRQIAKRLGVHPTTLIQRVKNLEEQGIIKGYRANVDYLKLGYEFMAIVHIYVEGDLLEVQRKIKEIENVVAVFDVTGECDSIAWVVCKNRDEFSGVIKRMLTLPGVKKTNTHVVLNMIKDPYNFIPELTERGPDNRR